MPAPVSDDILRRIWSEYAEMPGMSLTVDQGQRLWGVDESTCAAALEMLTAAGFLRKTAGSHYSRATEGRASLSSLRMARAELTGNGIPLLTEQPRRKAT
jgi:hypothetical protein